MRVDMSLLPCARSKGRKGMRPLRSSPHRAAEMPHFRDPQLADEDGHERNGGRVHDNGDEEPSESSEGEQEETEDEPGSRVGITFGGKPKRRGDARGARTKHGANGRAARVGASNGSQAPTAAAFDREQDRPELD